MSKSKKKLKSFPISEKCLVCYESFAETKDEITIQLLCGHGFHYDCIMESYKMKTSKTGTSITRRECPYCRGKGGYLPLLDGMEACAYVHKEYDMKIKYEKYYGKWGQCKGMIKNGTERCKNRAKYSVNGQLTGYCGKHKAQYHKSISVTPTPPTPMGPPVLV